MRKTFLILLLAGFSTLLQAGPVTPEKALQVAERVLSAQPVTKAGGSLRIIWDGESAQTKADAQEPAFYVVGRDGGGFVIVAGNDNVRPVLALSYTNRFQVEGMPENVRFWMERIKDYSRGTVIATPEVRAQWDAFAETKSSILPEASISHEFLKSRTVEWAQEDPANLKCPVVRNEKTVCGCVPLAFAEVMTWFGGEMNYPEKGTGTVSAYYYGRTSIPSHDLGTEYKWSELSLLKTYDAFHAEADTELGQNLGQLLYDIGTILQVEYDVSTGGDEEKLPTLCSYMGYSKSARVLFCENYPVWKWEEMLKEQVEQHPIYYGGFSLGTSPYRQGGHAYVIDGYATYNDTDLVFHFNFGWGGLCNGYYSCDYQILNLGKDNKDNDILYNFDTDLVAVFDFVPDPDNSSESVKSLSYLFSNNAGGLKVRQELDQNGLVQFAINNIYNDCNVEFPFTMAVFLVNPDGERDSQDIYNWDDSSEPGQCWSYNLDVYLKRSVKIGDKVSIFYKEGSSEYKQITFKDPSIGLDNLPLFPSAFIETEPVYHKDDYFYFRLTNHDYAYPDAQWSITDKDGEVTSCDQSEGRFKLTKTGRYTIKVTPVEGGETIVAVINVKEKEL